MSRLFQVLTRVYQNVAAMRLRWKFIAIALIALIIFFLSKGPSPGQNHFVYLADAFLHGRLGVTGGGMSLAEIVPFKGNYFVVYPPMPAVLLLPLRDYRGGRRFSNTPAKEEVQTS